MQVSEWQPIETAPKDGTRFIAFTTTNGDAELEAYLRAGGDCGEPLERVQVAWWDIDGQRWDLAEFIGNPTHWMQLPEPPNDQPRPALTQPNEWRLKCQNLQFLGWAETKTTGHTALNFTRQQEA